MNVKKKLKKFFTLKRRANDGFTLVELIVVIAIMAILAGVGTVAYSGYIKSANKGADKTLVGNIMRAVETGTNSYAFVSDDSFKMGNLSYPVGIITLSADKEDGTPGTCLVMASNAEKKEVPVECKMKTITNYVPVGGYSIKTEKGSGLGALTSVDVYTINKTESITFCENHSTPMESSVPTGVKKDTWLWVNTNVSGKDYKPYVFAEDCVGAYALATDHQEGGSITREELEAVQNAPRVEKTMSGELYDSLVAAFGDPSSLKLSYANWGTEEGYSHGSGYAYLTEAYEEMKGIAELCTDTNPIISLASKAYFGKTWDKPEDVMIDGLEAVDKMYGNNEEAWLAVWRATANEQYDQCGFGMNTGDPSADIVGYNTLRIEYNQNFASYLKTKGVPDQYTKVITQFDNGINAGEGSDVYLPAVVNYSAFAVDAEGNNPSKLKEKLKNAGDTDGTWFNKIATYYDEYVKSPAYEANAKAVMDMNTTMAQNGAVALKYPGGYEAYFQNYIDEMDAFYTAAENAAGDGIIIIVTVEKNEYGVSELNFQVSPSAANPRND